jgi:hypothetical protein
MHTARERQTDSRHPAPRLLKGGAAVGDADEVRRLQAAVAELDQEIRDTGLALCAAKITRALALLQLDALTSSIADRTQVQVSQ